MILTPVERALRTRLLVEAAECLRLKPPYDPRIFVGMIHKHGPVEACRRVIMELPAHQAPLGYSQLWERGRLDLTVEVTVLRSEWSSLFERTVLERASERLKRCGWTPSPSSETA